MHRICRYVSRKNLATGVFTPHLLQDVFVKYIDKFYAYDFLAMSLKFFWLTFEKNVKALAA